MEMWGAGSKTERRVRDILGAGCLVAAIALMAWALLMGVDSTAEIRALKVEVNKQTACLDRAVKLISSNRVTIVKNEHLLCNHGHVEVEGTSSWWEVW